MARPIPCDGPDGELAVLIVTNPENGEVNSFCLSCYCDFAQAFLSQFRPDALAKAPARGRGKRAPAAAAAVADDRKGGEGDGTADAADTRTA